MFENASAMQYRAQVCEHDALTASLSSPSRCGDEDWARKGGRKKAKAHGRTDAPNRPFEAPSLAQNYQLRNPVSYEELQQIDLKMGQWQKDPPKEPQLSGELEVMTCREPRRLCFPPLGRTATSALI